MTRARVLRTIGCLWVVCTVACSGSKSAPDSTPTSGHGPFGTTPAPENESNVQRDAAGLPPNAAANPAPMRPPSLGASGSASASIPQQAGAAGRAAASMMPLPQEPGADTSREQFESVGTNPFVLTAHDPFSTFAADVDTASYDIFRRNVNHGLLPVPASVRVEDYVNYFKYGYPAPPDGAEHPFQISLAAAPNAFGRATTLVRVGIQAENPPPQTKKPVNLVFLVDTSGSMQAADKLPLVQFLAKRSLDMLADGDRISIVTYSTEARVELAPTPVLRREEILPVIDRLRAEGSTNGAGGIQLAYEQAKNAFVEGGINHVMLCTDGDFNVGISDTDELVKFIEEKRKTGITLTALGFGIGNLNDAMMERVSNAGNGIYSVITSEEQASRYAEERMLATLVHVAKDLKIQIEWNPAQVEAYRLIGYENRAIADEDFRDDVVDAGEVGAGHRVTALYEVVRKGDAVPVPEGAPAAVGGDAVEGERETTPEDLVLVKVRYKLPGAGESDAAREVVQKLAPSEIGSLFDSADTDLRWVAAMAAFAEILKQSPYATRGALDPLRGVFAEQAGRDPDRGEFVQLFDRARALLPP